jgi:hypothetical protein
LIDCVYLEREQAATCIGGNLSFHAQGNPPIHQTGVAILPETWLRGVSRNKTAGKDLESYIRNASEVAETAETWFMS